MIARAKTRTSSSRTTAGMRLMPTFTAPVRQTLRLGANLHEFSKVFWTIRAMRPKGPFHMSHMSIVGAAQANTPASQDSQARCAPSTS